MRSAYCLLEFLRRISRRRRSVKYGVESIPEYVEQRAALLTPEQLDELRTDLPLLNVWLAAIEAPQFPHLQQQLNRSSTHRKCKCLGNGYLQKYENALALHFRQIGGLMQLAQCWLLPAAMPQDREAPVPIRTVGKLHAPLQLGFE